MVNNSGDGAYEDLAANNKLKTLKKQRKGTPLSMKTFMSLLEFIRVSTKKLFYLYHSSVFFIKQFYQVDRYLLVMCQIVSV